MASVWAELKRRNVIKVAVAYAIVAWLLVEVASTVLPTFEAPRWVLQTVTFVIILGFPLALILSWAFELTPEGLKRERQASAGEEVTGQAVVTEQSVAVLPFVDMSPDKDQEYFSDGIAEELLNQLSKLRGLHVAGRTSSFSFKNKDDDLQQIAEKLHVAHILEGSVRKAGNRVRITAQLIKASDGYHLWSDTFDRDLVDIFAIQDETARAVAEALSIALGVGESDLGAGGTRNFDAYDAFLAARSLRYQEGRGNPFNIFSGHSNWNRWR
jgi:adenylate cyclase